MVIIPASTAVAEGLTFTVGQIAWTTHAGGLTTMTLKENQIRSEAAKVVVPITSTTSTSAPTTLSAMPTTRPPLPHYKGKQVDDSDLLKANDRTNHKLSEASGLVNSISCQVTLMASLDFRESAQPTCATTHK